jgi:hypothetical protein
MNASRWPQRPQLRFSKYRIFPHAWQTKSFKTGSRLTTSFERLRRLPELPFVPGAEQFWIGTHFGHAFSQCRLDALPSLTEVAEVLFDSIENGVADSKADIPFNDGL